MSKITAIIRVKNEQSYIGFCIQSILDFFNKPEIIIINNNSNDQSIEIINHFKEDKTFKSMDKRYTDIKILDINKYTPGKALNLGVSEASHEYILIISAHCKIINFDKKNTFDYLDKNYAVFGNQLPIWNGKKILKRYIWSNFIEKKQINLYSEEEKRYFFHNAFSLFKKSTLMKYPFNENLIAKEDRYWANNFIKNKNKILYNPSNIVEHYYTNNGATWKNL